MLIKANFGHFLCNNVLAPQLEYWIPYSYLSQVGASAETPWLRKYNYHIFQKYDLIPK